MSREGASVDERVVNECVRVNVFTAASTGKWTTWGTLEPTTELMQPNSKQEQPLTSDQQPRNHSNYKQLEVTGLPPLTA